MLLAGHIEDIAALLEPFVVHQVSCLGPLFLLDVQNFLNKVLRLLGYSLKKHHIAFDDFSVEVFVSGSSEGEISAEECIKKDPSRPDIHWGAAVLFPGYDLRCHVTWSPTKYFNSLFIWHLMSELEVDQLYSKRFLRNPVSRQQDVFQLHFSVSNTSRMTIFSPSSSLKMIVLASFS